ncbi:Proteasomal ATPase-associated factor 1 [Apostichopus japonicus]|uniref:Proteasomal ATPase-associated factor 1 n=1 Tax=Stichopus japonicus TaxID=307972 RepID=A0A2G8JY13_STIJA|nr:Proteasomal ATPase-associated factor 1 [Apostichopus japonicus]
MSRNCHFSVLIACKKNCIHGLQECNCFYLFNAPWLISHCPGHRCALEMSSAAVNRGKLFIQNDWSKILKDNEGRAWISCKNIGETSISGELRSHGLNDEGLPILTASEGFAVSDITQKSLELTFKDKDLKTKFTSPTATLSSIHSKSIESLSISSGGELGVSAGSDGLLQVWQTNNGTVRRKLEGHAGDVNTCQFFPSGVVILSGGLDTQLKIWSVEDGSCPQTMRGHEGVKGPPIAMNSYTLTGSIVIKFISGIILPCLATILADCITQKLATLFCFTFSTSYAWRHLREDVCFIHQIRDSWNGCNRQRAQHSILLTRWHCKALGLWRREVFGDIFKGDGALNGCSVGVSDNSVNLGIPDKPTGEREVGTEGKLLLLAVEDGSLRGVGLRSRKEVNYGLSPPIKNSKRKSKK